jgi:hypothetical protein
MENLHRGTAYGTALILFTCAVALGQVDQHWWGLWNEAQKQRPKTLSSRGRIAAEGEPGTPLVIRGAVFHPDGRTPEAGSVVYAYHTDSAGEYFAPGEPKRTYRLQGWAKTDAAGRFEFVTIRPAPYPKRRIPAHVHFTIETSQYGRQSFGLLFADDPLVSDAERFKSSEAGRFGEVLKVQGSRKRQEVEMEVRLKRKGDF